jgi:hypothetical protein
MFARAALFDHLVGAGGQCRWNGNAECLAGFRLLTANSPRLQHLLRRMVHRAHIRDPNRPRRSALVLGAARPGGRETLRSSNHAATLEIAKAEFEASWKQWKAWAGMEETE